MWGKNKNTGKDKLVQSYSSAQVEVSILDPDFTTFALSGVFLTACIHAFEIGGIHNRSEYSKTV